MNNPIAISVIIPQRNALKTIPRLFNSIPVRDNIEIIVVDNSPIPISKDDIGVDRDYQLLWSNPERYAGGARNVGIENAVGKWLLFADADDYFTADAFDFFLSKVNSDADIIYTCMGGIYDDTGELSDRGDVYTNLVTGFCDGIVDEMELRLKFSSPCCKMVRRDFVFSHSLKYDEVVAANDKYFSLTSGFLAKDIEAVPVVTYIATVSSGSLTRTKSKEIIKSRFLVRLRCNQFLRNHGFPDYQRSMLSAFYEARHFGFKTFVEFLKMAIKFRQSPFVGWKRWRRSLSNIKAFDKSNEKYIVR